MGEVQSATAAQLVLLLVVMPAALGVGGLVWTAPLLDRFHQGRLAGRSPLRNWLRNGLPALCILLIIGGTLTVAGLAVTLSRPDLGLGPAVALSVAAILLVPTVLGRYRLMYRYAYESWARGTGLTRADVIVGVQEIVRLHRWQWIAITCIFNGCQAGLICLLVQGPSLNQLQLAWFPLAAGGAMTWLGMRMATLAHPDGQFLETVAFAFRANRIRQPDHDDDFLELNKHRDRQQGHGVAILLDSLPALQRSLNSILRRHPELSDSHVRKAAHSVLTELRQTAVAAKAVEPSEALRRAVRMVVREELPALQPADQLRPLDDEPGWSRGQAVLPGDLSRWLPYTASRVGRVTAAVVTVAAAIVTLLTTILK